MIDTHTHPRQGWNEGDSARCLEEAGLDKIVVAAAPIDHWGSDTNEGCARYCERFPERTVGLIGITPPDVEQSLRDIEKYHQQGFIGVKLMPTTGYYPDEEKHRRVFEEVNARKMICLSHCGWCSAGIKERDLPQSTLYSHPYHLEPLIRIFPDTDFIFAHGGGRTAFQAAFELVAYHKNAWVDTCPGQGTWVLQHAGHWLNVVNWDRVLFGTDISYTHDGAIPLLRKRATLVESLLQQAGLGGRTRAVMHENAKCLLEKHGVSVEGV